MHSMDYALFLKKVEPVCEHQKVISGAFSGSNVSGGPLFGQVDYGVSY